MNNNNRKIVLAPGNGCGDIKKALWYGWIWRQVKQKAPNVGFELKTFPDPLYARKEHWIPFIHEELHADSNTILVGHSSGAAASMRFAETNKLFGLILISAYSKDLGDELERASGYFSEQWNWDAIRRNCGFIVQFHCKDDHLVPITEGRFVHEMLHSDYKELETGGHFQQDAFPQLLGTILSHL